MGANESVNVVIGAKRSPAAVAQRRMIPPQWPQHFEILEYPLFVTRNLIAESHVAPVIRIASPGHPELIAIINHGYAVDRHQKRLRELELLIVTRVANFRRVLPTHFFLLYAF